MPVAKIAVSIDRKALMRVDRLVKSGVFPSRSKAIQDALLEKLDRLDHSRLAVECAKLDPAEEKAWAEERWTADITWPEY
jgi:Arc/MetJ-type ribon-helix-helix transcriptional regulator